MSAFSWRLLLQFLLGVFTGSWEGFRKEMARRGLDADAGAADQRADDAAADKAAEDRAGRIRDDLAKASDADVARRIDGL